jgi:acyl-[acyl-carrier-protein]-phospholipid O-acyltransferase / long-chain-fatty-acid--[acyl-carrier-protein] ligase
MSESPLPPENTPHSRLALTALLIVQAQNAFNDNFVKFVLIGLAVTAAAGTVIGEYTEQIFSAMIPLPFILLAPISGWYSDRYPKNRVIYFALILQLLIFILITVSLFLRSVNLAVFGFFLLAVQSTIFSPAKQGIIKEIVGSQKLGMANGLMQMLTMVGILGGMAVGGGWFDSELSRLNAGNGKSADNAWGAALTPVIGVGLCSLVPLVLGLFIKRTPEHREAKFQKAIFWSHFLDLKYVFRDDVLRRTGLLIAFYWLVANFLGLAFFGFAKELYPDVAEGGVSKAAGWMFVVIGGGLIVGSLLVSLLTSKGNRLGLAILGGFVMAAGFAAVGTLQPESLPWFGAVALVGFSSGFFVVPLNAHLQDQIEEDHRGRVLSAQNLMCSLSGVVAIIASSLMKLIGLSVSTQTLVFVPLIIIVTLQLHRMIRSSALKAV